MSKILDILKQEGDKKVDPTQEQLAEIYISPVKKKELVSRKEEKTEKKLSKGWLSLVLVLGIISVASLGLLFSGNKININIAVVKEERAEVLSSVAQELNPVAQELNFVTPDFPSHTIEFGGSADMESKLTDQYLCLVNSRGMGWADAKIKFSQPANMTNNIFCFSAKGKRGREALSVILKDTNNKTYQSINVAPNGLSKEWKRLNVRLNEAGRWIDLTAVSQVMLEFGSVTTNNPVGTAIYIKDLGLIKKEGLK